MTRFEILKAISDFLITELRHNRADEKRKVEYLYQIADFCLKTDSKEQEQ